MLFLRHGDVDADAVPIAIDYHSRAGGRDRVRLNDELVLGDLPLEQVVASVDSVLGVRLVSVTH